MLHSALLRRSQTRGGGGTIGLVNGLGQAGRHLSILSVLFAGFEPNKYFADQISVDMAELIIVFGTIAASLGLMVAFGHWWSR